MTDRRQWFKDRIGKMVYRNRTTCGCATCKNVYEKGLMIADEMHADYLWEIEGVSRIEETPEERRVMYFDTIEERDEFEKKL